MTLKHDVQCAIDGLCGREELIKEALEFCNGHKTYVNDPICQRTGPESSADSSGC